MDCYTIDRLLEEAPEATAQALADIERMRDTWGLSDLQQALLFGRFHAGALRRAAAQDRLTTLALADEQVGVIRAALRDNTRDNVTSLNPNLTRAAPEGEPDQEIVDLLEHFIQLARDGQITEIAITARNSDAARNVTSASIGASASLIGGLECLKTRLVLRNLGS